MLYLDLHNIQDKGGDDVPLPCVNALPPSFRQAPLPHPRPFSSLTRLILYAILQSPRFQRFAAARQEQLEEQ